MRFLAFFIKDKIDRFIKTESSLVLREAVNDRPKCKIVWIFKILKGAGTILIFNNYCPNLLSPGGQHLGELPDILKGVIQGYRSYPDDIRLAPISYNACFGKAVKYLFAVFFCLY